MLDSPPYSDVSTISPPFAHATLDAGAIHVDFRTFDVSANEQPVPLTRLEFDLLVYLIRRAGRVVGSEELMQQVVQSAYRKESSLIRVHVAHLRKKLGPTAESIVTVRGRGFLFRNPHTGGSTANDMGAPRRLGRLTMKAPASRQEYR